ncbi:unnamed protein product, partial [marine sediment metagenome]
DLSYNWAVTNAISSQAWIKASDADVISENIVSAQFKIKGYLNVDYPDASTVWTVGETRPITWTAVGTPSGGEFDQVKITYTTGTNWADIGTFANVSGTQSTPWTVADASSDDCRIKIETDDWENISV